MGEPRLHLVSQTTPDLFLPLLDSWVIALEAANKSAKTVVTYTEGLGLFARWLDEQYGQTDPLEVTRQQCREWQAHLVKTRSAGTAKNRHTSLTQFYRWLVTEDELDVSPMDGVPPPKLDEVPIDMLTDDQLRQLIASIQKDNRLVDRRDEALVLMYNDTGARLSELAKLEVDDVDLRERVARVVGKGNRERIVPFGARTARAIDRYKRMRDRQPYAHLKQFWLSGKDGRAITGNAIQQMLRRRGRVVGIQSLHPHMFRHAFADHWLGAEGQEGDLMELTGWRSRQMLRRYGAKNRAERARAAYQGRSPMDKL